MYRAAGFSKIVSVESSHTVSQADAATFLTEFAAARVTVSDDLHWEDVCSIADSMMDESSPQKKRLIDLKAERGESMSRSYKVEDKVMAEETNSPPRVEHENDAPESPVREETESKSESGEEPDEEKHLTKTEKKEARKRKKEERKARKEAKRAKKEAKKKKKEPTEEA